MVIWEMRLITVLAHAQTCLVQITFKDQFAGIRTANNYIPLFNEKEKKTPGEESQI